MQKSRFREEPLVHPVREVEAGTPAVEDCCTLGVSKQTFSGGKRQCAGMGVVELRRMCQVAEGNRTRKQVVADLTLDQPRLPEVLRHNGWRRPGSVPEWGSSGLVSRPGNGAPAG